MDGVLRWRRNGDWGWRGGVVTATDRAVEARLDGALRRLERLARQPEGHEIGSAAEPALSCALQRPATLEEIAGAELRLGAALPGDYRRFLLRSNGAMLSMLGPDDSRLVLLGTDGLVAQAEATEGALNLECVTERVLFAAIGNEDDALAFDISRMNPYGGCAVLDARNGFRPDRWWVVACDFTSWLTAVLREMGPSGSFGRSWAIASPQLALPHLDDDTWD